MIRPALERGAWVVCDRYIDSSLVYQGIARGLGVERVLELNRLVTGGLMPARTFVLAARARGGARAGRAATSTGSSARTRSSGRSVADGYRELAALFPERVVAARRVAAAGRRSRSRYVSRFERFSEQQEAKRLLDAALVEGPVHAYLFHGPAGRRQAASSPGRSRTSCSARPGAVHPDLYELDALGEMIRIDAIRELRRDLHMRPFEADAARLPDPERAPDERGRGRRAAEGPRGAARRTR